MLANGMDTMDVIFPPSVRPKMRKLVIRNTSTRLLVAKLKLICASPEDKQENLAAVIPPNSFQNIMLVCLPSDYADEFKPGENAPPLYLTLKDKDQLEIYCRTMFIDGTDDLAKKMRYKVQNPNNGSLYRITYTKLPNSEDLSKLGKRERSAWWEARLNEMVKEKADRFNELKEWALSDEDEPEMLTQKLRVVRDAKRFAAPTILIEIPGIASLVESVPYTMEKIDDTDCVTAHNIGSGTSTANLFNDEQLLQLAPSNSLCLTARNLGGVSPCDWMSQWLNWFLPIKVVA